MTAENPRFDQPTFGTGAEGLTDAQLTANKAHAEKMSDAVMAEQKRIIDLNRRVFGEVAADGAWPEAADAYNGLPAVDRSPNASIHTSIHDEKPMTLRELDDRLGQTRKAT